MGFAAAGMAMAAVPSKVFASAATPMALDPRLMSRAMTSLGRHRGQVRNADIIAIADFSQASKNKRFHLVDIVSGVTTSMLVAHGRGSDPAHSGWLQQFSNADGSYASCSGAFVTGAEYFGKHGRSMRLDGLDASNSNALERAIVVHTAPYVTEAMARETGKIGRSQGCFAVTEADLQQVLARMGSGRFLYSDKV